MAKSRKFVPTLPNQRGPANPYVDADKKRQKILNALPSPTPKQDYTKAEGPVGAGSFDYPLLAMQPANESDLTTGTGLYIGNQGYTGSCVGWAVGGVVEYLLKKAGRMSEGDYVSPKATWQAARVLDSYVGNDLPFLCMEGTYPKVALDWHRKTGAALDGWMPNWGDCPLTQPEFLKYAAPFKIKAYFNLGADQVEWMRWLSAGYPLVATIQVDDAFLKLSDNTALTTFTTQKEGLHGLHCVGLYGHRRDKNGIATFTVRNSWGTGWGAGGYGYLHGDYLVDSAVEVWGVVA